MGHHVAPPHTAAVTHAALEAAAGDVVARTEFWEHHARQVRTWLWFRWSRSSLRGCIDDAAQEVYLECCRPGGALTRFVAERAEHGFAGFLRGVVRNVAHRFEHQRARERAQRADYADTRSAALATVERQPGDAGPDVDHEQVVAALEHLDRDDPARGTPRSLRTFLRLHFDEGLPVRTIARRWQEPADRVHELRRRACRRFRACLLTVLRGCRADQPAT